MAFQVIRFVMCHCRKIDALSPENKNRRGAWGARFRFFSRLKQATEEWISELDQTARPQFEFILFYHKLLD